MAHAQKPDFVFPAKRTSPFKSAGASVQSTIGSQGVHISSSNAGYTTLQGSGRCTGYALHSPVSPSLPLPCVTACHHISTGLYSISLPHTNVQGLLIFTRTLHYARCICIFNKCCSSVNKTAIQFSGAFTSLQGCYRNGFVPLNARDSKF
jgi:hypothetical protein